jgi:hypothetical protein
MGKLLDVVHAKAQAYLARWVIACAMPPAGVSSRPGGADWIYSCCIRGFGTAILPTGGRPWTDQLSQPWEN